MTSIMIRLNQSRVNKEGQYPLVIQIIRHRRKREIYTSYRLYKHEFNAGKEKLCKGRRSKLRGDYIREAQEYVIRMKELIEAICKRLEVEKKDYSVDDVFSVYKCYNDYNNLFVFAEYLSSELIRQSKEGTSSNYRQAVQAFARFVNDPSFTFDRLTPQLIEKYRTYLRQKGNKPNTIWHYIYQLRVIYRKAASMHIVSLQADPFADIEVRKEKTPKRAISEDKLHQIAEARLSDKDDLIQLVRDLFMFSFYTRGMSFVDMCYLRKENIRGDILSYRRKKTEQLLEIKIEPVLDALIKKYADPSSPYLLPMLSKDDSYQAYRNIQRALNK